MPSDSTLAWPVPSEVSSDGGRAASVGAARAVAISGLADRWNSRNCHQTGPRSVAGQQALRPRAPGKPAPRRQARPRHGRCSWFGFRFRLVIGGGHERDQRVGQREAVGARVTALNLVEHATHDPPNGIVSWGHVADRVVPHHVGVDEEFVVEVEESQPAIRRQPGP